MTNLIFWKEFTFLFKKLEIYLYSSNKDYLNNENLTIDYWQKY